MEVAGLPLHVLVIHAVVVFAPLAALTAVGYAVATGWRWALRWPLVAVTLLATAGAVLAVMSGESLAAGRGLDQLPAVQTHAERGELLRNTLLAFTVLVALGAFRLGGPSALVSGGGARRRYGGAVDAAVSTLLVLGALAVLLTATLAGHSGSAAVWG